MRHRIGGCRRAAVSSVRTARVRTRGFPVPDPDRSRLGGPAGRAGPVTIVTIVPIAAIRRRAALSALRWRALMDSALVLEAPRPLKDERFEQFGVVMLFALAGAVQFSIAIAQF